MRRKPKKHRKRVEAEIYALAQHDPEAAEELVLYGRNRTEAELATWLYLWGVEHLKRNAGAPLPTRREIEESAEELCRVFLDAVDKRDTEALSQITSEVKHFQYHLPYDHVKAGILTLRNILEKGGRKMTIPRLAALLNRKLVGAPPVAPPTADGYSNLRQKAKKLKFPIAPSKRGKEK